VGLPDVTLLQPTMIIAVAASVPITRAAIRTRLRDDPPISTVCRRYRFVPAVAGSFTPHTRQCEWGTMGGR
jgi:hypothetical protein